MKIRLALALLCVFAMLVTSCVSCDNGGSDIRIVDGYVEFGSYPQTEVVSQASDCGTYGKAWVSEGDCIVDATLYATLSGLPESQWDDNGDVTLDGNRYRRIKKSDATTAKSGEATLYEWASDTYHYFKYEPIRWKVLKQDGNEVLLLSEKALDTQMFNTNITGTLTWATSTIRSWLNGYGASANECGTDCSSDNFIDTAFTSGEQSRIKTTAVVTNDSINSGVEGGDDTNDRIFILSEEDVYGEAATAYGFSSSYNEEDSARQAKSSTYAKAMGAETSDLGGCDWWLRTPGSYPGLFMLIKESGRVYRGGQHANSKSRGVRPAMYVTID